MDNATLQTILAIAAVAVFLLYIMRRRGRKKNAFR